MLRRRLGDFPNFRQGLSLLQKFDSILVGISVVSCLVEARVAIVVPGTQISAVRQHFSSRFILCFPTNPGNEQPIVGGKLLDHIR